jgi:hypothetical protein
MKELINLEKNVNNLQEKIYSVNFDISKSFASDKQVVKNIIKSKNPSMTKDDIEIMVEGNADSLKKAVPVNTVTANATNAATTVDTIAKTDPKDEENRQLSEFSKKNKLYPLTKDSIYYQESKKMKDDVRKSVMLLFKEQKELMQDLSKTSIQVASSISGAAILIAPLSFNVPGAISVVLLVIDGISKIVSKMMNVISHLGPLKYLALLIPEDKADSIIKPINVMLSILISLFNSTKLLQKLIDKLMKSLKKRIKTANTADIIKGQCDVIKGELNELLIQQKKIILLKLSKTQRDAIQKKIDAKKEEVRACQERADELANIGDLEETVDGKFAEVPLNELLTKIDPDLSEQLEKITDANNEFYSYVYDVHFPDGSMKSNLSDDELEAIKNKYNLIFEDISQV